MPTYLRFKILNARYLTLRISNHYQYNYFIIHLTLLNNIIHFEILKIKSNNYNGKYQKYYLS